jgi:hypothetical protein
MRKIYVVLFILLKSSEFFVKVITRWAKGDNRLRFREEAMVQKLKRW